MQFSVAASLHSLFPLLDLKLTKRCLAGGFISYILERGFNDAPIQARLLSVTTSDNGTVDIEHTHSFDWLDKLVSALGYLDYGLGIVRL